MDPKVKSEENRLIQRKATYPTPGALKLSLSKLLQEHVKIAVSTEIKSLLHGRHEKSVALQNEKVDCTAKKEVS